MGNQIDEVIKLLDEIKVHIENERDFYKVESKKEESLM